MDSSQNENNGTPEFQLSVTEQLNASHKVSTENGGTPSTCRPLRWNRQTILAELKRLHVAGHDIGSRNLRRTFSSLYSAATYWFESYRIAVEAAGLNYTAVRHQDPKRWDADAIVNELRKRHAAKLPMHENAMRRDASALVTACYRAFGNYRKAVNAAGFDFTTLRARPAKRWTVAEIVRQLTLLKEQGANLWRSAVKDTAPNLVRAAERHFGRYQFAVEAAGLNGHTKAPRAFRRWSPAAVLAELQRMHGSGESMAPTQLSVTRPSFYRACSRRFGTYRNAVEAAGIPYASIARVLNKPLHSHAVVAQLKAIYEKGGDLRYTSLYESYPRLAEAARRRFRTYKAAMLAAGLEYPPKPPLRHWTMKLVVLTLQELHAAGEDLRYTAVKRFRLPLYQATRYYFGEYAHAVEKAGIDYDAMVRQQRALEAASRSSKS